MRNEVPATVGGLEQGVRTDMLEEVQRNERWPSGEWPTSERPRVVLFTGSREWGEERKDQMVPEEWIKHELHVSARAFGKLVDKYVLGLTKFDGKRQSADTIELAPGLVVVEGGAPGLDTKIRNAATVSAFGLHRRSRAEFALYAEFNGEDWNGPQLAEGLWLYTFPADWENRPRHLAGPERNQRMLDETKPDHVIAFFAHGRNYGSGMRGGTNDMVRRAVKAGVPVDIYVANERRWRKP